MVRVLRVAHGAFLLYGSISRKDALSSKSTSNMVGQLHLPEMTVWVERFRGSFSQQFGSPRFDHASNSMKTELNPWEAFFLADMVSSLGVLVVLSLVRSR